ncbi:geranylgeranyl transferase type-1 subunit beta-like isoform X1 [Salvia hispanica]|uniref:geranylgeranyl transferase type-1 subunit beta-like isoform X1 n=1 Tax=Salvia hispanica TaxID=49212 RepID=UPI0020090602|nr:geranylgeranyl transferase type-1 subunit beta-like isoform X1 [Salvia hispanica]
MEDEEFCDFDSESLSFEKDRHIYYLEMMYRGLPAPYQGQETIRLTLAYFVISGLDIFGALDRIDKEAVINWVLSLQAHPKDDRIFENGQFYGFHGSRSSQFQSDNDRAAQLNGSHLASTYCALAILKTVGYDLSQIDSEVLLKSMRTLQQPNGCFMPIHTGGETDLRFVFCAAAICSMLKNWSGMDREKAKEFIRNCQSYDGGFGLLPGAESHGGATYCAVASLKLMGFLGEDSLSGKASSDVINVPLLLDWSVQKQAFEDGGFRGRANKATDTCYAFWVGGTLRIVQADKFINEEALRGFLLTCQYKLDPGSPLLCQYGGFSKFPRMLPDIYHSYYGFCAFSMLREPGLNPLCVELGISAISAIGL